MIEAVQLKVVLNEKELSDLGDWNFWFLDHTAAGWDKK